MVSRLLVAILLLLAGCSGPHGTQAASPEGSSSPAPSTGAPTMPAEPTHRAIDLDPPYYPWQEAYERVRADPILGAALKDEMIPALEAAGPPEERLRTMGEAANAARARYAAQGQQADFTFQGMDPVEVDLKVVFFRDLAAAIAADSSLSTEAKREALESLLPLVEAESPVGLPAPDERVPHTQTARLTAKTMIEAKLEAL